MPKPTAGIELPSPSETRESALVQVSEAMALLIRRAETSTKPAITAVGPSCGMQNDDAMQVTRSKNMSSRARMQRRDAYTWARDDDRQNQLKMLKPRQETDLYVSLEMGIGRPTANKGPFGPLIQKFILNGFDLGRANRRFWQLCLTRAASVARIRQLYVFASCQGVLASAEQLDRTAHQRRCRAS